MLLPVATLGAELRFGWSGEIYFDPIPTWLHVFLIGSRREPTRHSLRQWSRRVLAAARSPRSPSPARALTALGLVAIAAWRRRQRRPGV